MPGRGQDCQQPVRVWRLFDRFALFSEGLLRPGIPPSMAAGRSLPASSRSGNATGRQKIPDPATASAFRKAGAIYSPFDETRAWPSRSRGGRRSTRNRRRVEGQRGGGICLPLRGRRPGISSTAIRPGAARPFDMHGIALDSVAEHLRSQDAAGVRLADGLYDFAPRFRAETRASETARSACLGIML